MKYRDACQTASKIALQNRDSIGKLRDEKGEKSVKKLQEGRAEGCVRSGKGSQFLSVVVTENGRALLE